MTKSGPPSRQSLVGTPSQQFVPQRPSPCGTIATMDSQQQHGPPPQHLVDVYNGSHSDMELAENMGTFLSRKVPAPIWLTLSVIQIVAGLVSLFIGAFHASPYQCPIEPNIPVYLIVSGILLIINGGIRLFFWLTSNKNKQRSQPAATTGAKQPQQQQRIQKRSGAQQYRHLWEYALEGVVLLGCVVVVILGCVWVYGAARYMYSLRYSGGYSSYGSYGGYGNRFCDPTLYWTAWWSVTLHLGFFALLILGGIILLVYGALLG